MASDFNYPLTCVMPVGTKIPFVLQEGINSKNAKGGDPFLGRAKKDVTVDGKIWVAAGAPIIGHLIKVEHLKRDSFTVVFDRLVLSNGRAALISGSMARHSSLMVMRDGQPMFYPCPTRMGCTGMNFSPSPPKELYGYDSTTIIGPQKGAPIELKANDELSLEVCDDIRY